MKLALCMVLLVAFVLVVIGRMFQLIEPLTRNDPLIMFAVGGFLIIMTCRYATPSS